MLVRITSGVKCGLTGWVNSSYPRIGEVAVFGNANPTLGYTVTENKADVDVSNSLIAGTGGNYIVNNVKAGTKSYYPGWLVSHFKAMDGDINTRADINVLNFNDNHKAINMGSSPDATMDIVTSLTEKDGKQTDVKGVYVASSEADGSERLTYKYAIYISNTLDTLDSEDSLVATYCNVNLKQTQYFEFATPVRGAYMLVRINMSQPVNGHGKESGAANQYTNVRLSEIAVFGQSASDYTITNTAPADLTQSVIYGTNKQHSLVQTTANGNQSSASVGVEKLTDGNLFVSLDWGFSSGDNNNGQSVNRFHSYGSNKFQHNNGTKLETYEDFIFDLREKCNNAVDISSFFIGTTEGSRALYKFEVYASNSRDALCSSENLVATCSNISKSGNINVTLAQKVKASYVMLRVIFCEDYKSGYQNWECTRITEFAVFGTESTGYTVSANTTPSDALYKSYISGTKPLDCYIYDGGQKYSLNTGATYKLTNSQSDGGFEMTTIGADTLQKGSFFSGDNRRNLNTKPDVYVDTVYKLNYYGKSVNINEVYIGEHFADDAVADFKKLTAYSYEIYAADKAENLGKEESVVATVVNANAATKNLVKFAKPVSAKYIMVRCTMGTQFNARSAWGDNLTYARTGSIAVFGDKTVLNGDVNADDVIDIRDFIRFKKYIASNDAEFVTAAADVDESGTFESAQDLTALIKFLLTYAYRTDSYEFNGELTQEIANSALANAGNKTRLAAKLASFENGG